MAKLTELKAPSFRMKHTSICNNPKLEEKNKQTKKPMAGQKHYSDSHVLIISCTNSDFLEDHIWKHSNVCHTIKEFIKMGIISDAITGAMLSSLFHDQTYLIFFFILDEIQAILKKLKKKNN